MHKWRKAKQRNNRLSSRKRLLHGDVKTTANPTKHVSPAQNRNHKAFQTEIQTYLEVTQSSSVKKLNKHIQKQTIIKTCNQTITYAKEIGFGWLQWRLRRGCPHPNSQGLTLEKWRIDWARRLLLLPEKCQGRDATVPIVAFLVVTRETAESLRDLWFLQLMCGV